MALHKQTLCSLYICVTPTLSMFGVEGGKGNADLKQKAGTRYRC